MEARKIKLAKESKHSPENNNTTIIQQVHMNKRKKSYNLQECY